MPEKRTLTSSQSLRRKAWLVVESSELSSSPGWVSKKAGPLGVELGSVGVQLLKATSALFARFPCAAFQICQLWHKQIPLRLPSLHRKLFSCKDQSPRTIYSISRSHEGLGNFTRTNSTYYLPYPISNISYIQFLCSLFKIRCQYTNAQRHVEFQT